MQLDWQSMLQETTLRIAKQLLYYRLTSCMLLLNKAGPEYSGPEGHYSLNVSKGQLLKTLYSSYTNLNCIFNPSPDVATGRLATPTCYSSDSVRSDSMYTSCFGSTFVNSFVNSYELHI